MLGKSPANKEQGTCVASVWGDGHVLRQKEKQAKRQQSTTQTE